MVSHDRALIGHMCDRLAVMQAGRVVEALDGARPRGGGAAAP